uniref:Amino acid transporter n=1 Tax=Hucho hucho TaxID=62062 RepID=A0A4W5M0Z6_9TELE
MKEIKAEINNSLYYYETNTKLVDILKSIRNTVCGPRNCCIINIKYLSFPGELLIRMLQMLVLPLIVSSRVTWISSLDTKVSGRMGIQAIYYTVIAVFTGIILVIILQPGKGTRAATAPSGGIITTVQTLDAFMDLVRFVSDMSLNINISLYQYPSSIKPKRISKKNITTMVNLTQTSGTITSSAPATFGRVLGGMKTRGQPLKDFFDCLNEAIMRLVSIIVWYAPVGILFLIAGKIVEMRDVGAMGGQLGMYTLCVITGLLVHSLITLPLGTTHYLLLLAVAAVFIAQVNNMDLNFAASIGAAGIPQAGLVTMVIVLNSVGLPTNDITLIAVDWFLDRLRTTTNVLGDSLGVGIEEHLSRHKLQVSRTAVVDPGSKIAAVDPLVREERGKPFLHTENNTACHQFRESSM